MSKDVHDWISITEACKHLGISRNTLKKLVREGIVPAYRIQGVIGYRLKRNEVEALVRPVVVVAQKKLNSSSRTTRSTTRSQQEAGVRDHTP
jgi:excisionase family DNA binding protein